VSDAVSIYLCCIIGNGPGLFTCRSRRSLNARNFDSETARILSVAYELTCIALRVRDCDYDIEETIANKIIGVAKSSGERDPDLLCEQELKDIRPSDI
jgi:hypothetical protein